MNSSYSQILKDQILAKSFLYSHFKFVIFSMKHREAIDHILNLMQEELPDKLRYHSLGHTLGVLRSCEFIASKHSLDDETLKLVLTAAAYHDSGFTKTYKNHESVGCEIAQDSLPNFDFTQIQIDRIKNMIRATKIPQSPRSLEEKILCDADLDYLGGGKYGDISESLYDELGLNGIEINADEWLDMQINFLEAHHYWTDFALEVLKPKKQAILDKLIAEKENK